MVLLYFWSSYQTEFLSRSKETLYPKEEAPAMMSKWQEKVEEKQNEVLTLCNSILADYAGNLQDYEKTNLENFVNEIKDIRSIEELDIKIQELNEFKNELQNRQDAKELEEQRARESGEPIPDYTTSNSSNYSDGDFQSQGVINQNGYRYTYYSSNVLRHYRTDEWTAGDDGIYRDSSGYVVVASDAHPQGSIVSTPFGEGRVYDTGVGRNDTIDIYTNY